MVSEHKETDVIVEPYMEKAIEKKERLIHQLKTLETRLLSQTEKYMKQRCELVSFILVDLLPYLPAVSREPLEKHLWRLLK